MPIEQARTGRLRARRTALAVCTPLLAIALAACGSDQAEPKVATAGGSAPADATAESVDWTAYDTYMRDFVTCLNDRGLPAVRYLGHDRRQEEELSGMPKGDQVNPVVAQCGELVRPVDRPVTDPPPKPTEEELRFGRTLAACMRENGLPDYPDPDPDPANSDPKSQGDVSAEQKLNPKFRSAQEKCLKDMDVPPPTGSVG